MLSTRNIMNKFSFIFGITMDVKLCGNSVSWQASMLTGCLTELHLTSHLYFNEVLVVIYITSVNNQVVH